MNLCFEKKDIVSKFGSAFADVKRFLQRSNDLFDANFYNFDQIHDGVEVLVNAVELSKFKRARTKLKYNNKAYETVSILSFMFVLQ